MQLQFSSSDSIPCRQPIAIAIMEQLGSPNSSAWEEYGINNVATGLQDVCPHLH